MNVKNLFSRLAAALKPSNETAEAAIAASMWVEGYTDAEIERELELFQRTQANEKANNPS